MLTFLKITSAIFIGSFILMGFIGFNGLIFTSTFTLFILTVVFNVVKTYKGKYIIDTMEDESFNLAAGYFKNKKYIRSIIYLMSYPASIVGLLFALISLVCMWVLVIAK